MHHEHSDVAVGMIFVGRTRRNPASRHREAGVGDHRPTQRGIGGQDPM